MPHPKNKYQRLLIGNKKAEKVSYSMFTISRLSEQQKKERLGILRKTRKFCSSPDCCGNPRRLKGQKEETLQEIKAKKSSQSQLEDVEIKFVDILKKDI